MLRCSTSEALAFEWHQTAFDGIEVDTGWLPANSNVQARFAVRLLGNAEISFDAALDASWDPSDVEIGVYAEDDAGWIEIGYGLEIAAQFRFNVSIFGQSASWTGDIPTPVSLPSDLLIAAQAQYTPLLLPGSMPESVSLSDETGRVSAFEVGLTDDIIDVPGIGGRFALQVAASLEAEYRDERVAIEGGSDIVAANTVSVLDATTADGHGPALDAGVRARGRLEYTPGITLYPNVRLVVFGFTIIDRDLFSLHLDLPSFSSQVDFDEVEAHVSLPDLWVDSQPLLLRGADGGAVLRIENRGEMSLLVDLQGWPNELVAVDPTFSIEAGSHYEVPVEVRPELFLDGLEQVHEISLHSNDPDAAVTTVRVDILIPPESGESEGDDDVESDAPALAGDTGCGCRSSGGRSGAGAVPLLLALAILGWRRRWGFTQ